MSNTEPAGRDRRQAAKPSSQKPDYLLQCLMQIAKYYQRPTSARSLIAGLPLEHDRLSADLFARAAERVELSAKTFACPLTDIDTMTLPVILLMHEEQACLLMELHDDKAEVILPQTGSGVVTIELDELQQRYTGEAIFIKPNYQFTRRSDETLYETGKNWFWRVFVQALPIYSEVLLASALINTFALAIPLFVMNVYDRVVPNFAIETMWVLASGVAIVFCFDFIMRTLRGYFIDSAGRQVDVKLSAIIFQQILGIQMGSRPNSVGAFANSVQSFEIFRDFITSTTVAVLVDLPFVFLYLMVIYLVGGNVVWIPCIMIPLVIIVGLILQLPLIRLTKESYQHAAEKQATLIESLSGAEAIKSAGAESTMQRRWEQIVALSAELGVKLRMVSNSGINFSVFAQQLTSVLVVITGVYAISNGDMTTGALIACTILTGRAMGPITQLAALLTRYFQSMNALKSLNTIMDLPVDRPRDRRHLHRPTIHGNIRFNNVSFNYPNSEISALHNISLEIKEGERVAIIGRIGSGKTTIAKLIMQFYQPVSGNILIDNTEYSQLDSADIRHSIGYVPQDITLFYGSVKENISLGAPHVDDDAVLRAARIAGVNKFIENHPHGYDLQVGEGGKTLSRGQRQTIAVARALLLDPPIIIMDEPTTSMDDATEGVFKRNLREYLRQNKTLIIVTHKASLLQLVDRIIVVDSGKIVADGPKDAVLAALKQGGVQQGKGTE